MTELVVVRHGQASYAAADYDVLSALGQRQSELLGQWLATRDDGAFDLIVRGSLQRHRHTLDGIAAAFEAAGRPLPAAQELGLLDEFDHRAVIAAYARTCQPSAALLAGAGLEALDRRALYAFLRAGLGAWADGALDDHVPEPWAVFKQRVVTAVAQLSRQCAGRRRALIVTSGGVISQMARIALELPDRRAVALNLSIRNSAVCEFHLHDGELSLISWNTLPHLAHPDSRELLTWY